MTNLQTKQACVLDFQCQGKEASNFPAVECWPIDSNLKSTSFEKGSYGNPPKMDVNLLV